MISEDENEIPDTILAIVDIISSFSAQQIHRIRDFARETPVSFLPNAQGKI